MSISHTDATVAYIEDQREHHRRRGFDQELEVILKKHGIED